MVGFIWGFNHLEMLNICQRAEYDVTSPPAWAENWVICVNSITHQVFSKTSMFHNQLLISHLHALSIAEEGSFCNSVFIPSGLTIWAFRLDLSLFFKYFYKTLSNGDWGFCPALPFVPLECNLVCSHSIMNKIPEGCRKAVCPSVQVLNRKVVQATVAVVVEDRAAKGGASFNTAQFLTQHAARIPEASYLCREIFHFFSLSRKYYPLFVLPLSSTQGTAVPLILLVHNSKEVYTFFFFVKSWLLSVVLFKSIKTP